MASTTAATDAKPAPAAGGPQLKLLVDRRSRRVLYAEARKDAVDFLIGLLRVPAGLAARELAKHGEPAPGQRPHQGEGDGGLTRARPRGGDEEAARCNQLRSPACPPVTVPPLGRKRRS